MTLLLRLRKRKRQNLALSDEEAVCTADVDRILKRLKKGKAAGADGILAEHLIHANCSHLRLLLCDLIAISHTFSVIPSCFRVGVLYPILKKPHLDPSVPKNYRPITVSSTLAKQQRLWRTSYLESVESMNSMTCSLVSAKGSAPMLLPA